MIILNHRNLKNKYLYNQKGSCLDNCKKKKSFKQMSFQMNHVGLKKKKKGFFREITEKNIPLF